jgi:hypothetical protein
MAQLAAARDGMALSLTRQNPVPNEQWIDNQEDG